MVNIEEKTKTENELLDIWATDISGFIRDGVVDPQQYYTSPLKILILLKEVNGGKDWDLRNFLKTGGRAQTWDNIARWVEGITNLDKELTWGYLEKNNEQRRLLMLKKICAVNVKKVSGGHTADNKTIKLAAKNNSVNLQKQFNLYSPDLVICAGTESSYFSSICTEDNPTWQMTSRGIWYVRESTGRIVVSYSHPEARVKDSILYYGLIDALKEIYNK